MFPLVVGLGLLRPGVQGELERVRSVEQLPHYELDLSLSDTLGTYRGRGTLTWTNTTGTTVAVLPLQLHPNGPSETGATSRASMTLSVLAGGRAEQVRPSLVEVTLDTPLAPGDATTLELDFGGELQLLRDDANDLWAQAGMGGGLTEATDYGLLGEGDGLLTAASAYPMVAPWTGDGFATDPPAGIGDLAWGQPMSFDVRIVTPAWLRPVTNLVDGPVEQVGQGSVVHARGTGVRDFVLVASRDWAVAERRVGDVTVRSWSLARDAEVGREVLDEGCDALESLDRRLVDYPYTELDIVEATLAGGAGGVEFSGLVLIAGFFYRDPTTSQSPMAMMMRQLGGSGGGLDMGAFLDDQRAFVVAHEVAHQWSPGLVGADSASAPLVDEALAQYLAGTVTEDRLGRDAGRELTDRSVALNYAAYRLLGGKDGPANRPVDAYSSALEYAALVYGKAPYLYRALEDRHGQDAVYAAMRKAMASLAWREADVSTWLGLLEVHGLRGATELGRRWLDEAHGDEDLGLDPEGWRALELMMGAEMVEGLRPMFGMMGMTPAMLFGGLGGGLPAQLPVHPGTQPTPDELLDLLQGR